MVPCKGTCDTYRKVLEIFRSLVSPGAYEVFVDVLKLGQDPFSACIRSLHKIE